MPVFKSPDVSKLNRARPVNSCPINSCPVHSRSLGPPFLKSDIPGRGWQLDHKGNLNIFLLSSNFGLVYDAIDRLETQFLIEEICDGGRLEVYRQACLFSYFHAPLCEKSSGSSSLVVW